MMLPLVLLLLVSGHVTFAALTIGSFNIQRLGNTKVADHTVLNRIVEILLRFDIAVILEVLHEDAINLIRTELNKRDHPYSLSLSGLLGSTSYKEYVAILYRSDLVSVRGTDVYPDSGDHFEREPYSVLFHTTQASVTDFALMGVHLRPDSVPAEMNSLVDAASHTMSKLNTQNLLIAGDFNADCNYLSNAAYQQSALYTSSQFHFLLDKDSDSTTSHTTSCAYDRFVAAGNQLMAAVVSDSAKVYDFESGLHLTNAEALAISDHYPIELQLSGGTSSAAFAAIALPRLWLLSASIALIRLLYIREEVAIMMLRFLLTVVSCAHLTKASLLIGAFNVKRLYNSKTEDHNIVNLIAKILGRYDMAVVEEVMHTEAIAAILTEMNSLGGPFTMSLGPATGRTSYKEHVAIIYRNDKMEARGTDLYPDDGDKFERDPYTVSFHTTHASVTNFAVMGVHLKPFDVENEMNNLVGAYEHTAAKLGTQNILIAGDFNADCTYLTADRCNHTALWTDGRFNFLIYSNVDTTTSHHTNCAYDRFVASGNELKAAVVQGSVQVYNFETEMHLSFSEAWNVSDHYPIQLQLQ